MAVHDLRVEISHGEDWVFVWCPCGWKTEVKYRFHSRDVDEMKRAFHGHLTEEPVRDPKTPEEWAEWGKW